MKEQELRQQLADELQSTGDLRSPEWRAALEAVPRHLFVPEFFRAVKSERGIMWHPVTGANTDRDAWMKLVYENQTCVTQIDGRINPSDVSAPIPAGNPTSSSTLPGLVIAMLEDLDVNDSSNVLEIGTGSGYSTALLCARLGAGRVASIEADPGIASGAATAINGLGYSPTLVTGDGLEGFPQRSPYDRIIATCSVRHIPGPWIAQCRPGAIILATLSGWQYSSAYVKLTVGPGGTAQGRCLPQTYSFMLARSHMPPPLDIRDTREVDAAAPRPAVVEPEALNDWTAGFIAQLAAPDAQCTGKRVDDGPMIDYYVDSNTGSVASLTPRGDGTHLVREAGPSAVWASIEKAIITWQEAGSPGIDHFQISITPDGQTVYSPAMERPGWRLPA